MLFEVIVSLALAARLVRRETGELMTSVELILDAILDLNLLKLLATLLIDEGLCSDRLRLFSLF